MQNTNEQQKRKDDLFLKVSIENIHGGIVAAVGLREYAVLQVIASYTDNEGKCYPNQETLAEVCGVSKRQMIRLIDNLCKVRIDGKPILLRETKRLAEKKTKNYYTVLPLAGMAFGDNKVVSKVSRPKTSEVEHCEDLTEGSDKTCNKVVTESVKGTDKNVTLTKAIELKPLELNPLEQEPVKEMAIVEDKKESLSKTNNVIENKELNIVAKDKETNKAIIEEPKEVQSDIVEDYEVKRIAASIVAKGRGKSNTKEDGHTGHMAADTASKQPTEGKPLSLSKIAREREEASRKAREKVEAERKAKRNQESASLLQAISYKTRHKDNTASELLSKGNPSVQNKPVTVQHGASIEDNEESFDDMFARLFG